MSITKHEGFWSGAVFLRCIQFFLRSFDKTTPMPVTFFQILYPHYSNEVLKNIYNAKVVPIFSILMPSPLAFDINWTISKLE